MTKNMNYEFFLRNSFSNEVLAGALGSLLGVESGKILIIKDISDSNETADVFIEREDLGGDFRCFLSVYIGIPVAEKSEIDFVVDVCGALKCDALCAGDDSNPYLWVLVQHEAGKSNVLLRDEPYDERGEAVLCEVE